MGIKIDGDYGTMHRILKILAWRYATVQELSEILSNQTVGTRTPLTHIMLETFCKRTKNL